VRVTKNLASVGIVYGASVGLLMVAELVLARLVTLEAIGQYQFARQLVPVAALIGAVGIDQAMPRHGAGNNLRPRTRLREIGGSAVVVACIATFTAVFIFRTSAPWGLAIGLAIVLVSVTSVWSAEERASLRYFRAALYLHGYRLVLALGLLGVSLLLALGFGHLRLPGVLIIATVIPVLAAGWQRRSTISRYELVSHVAPSRRSLRRVGIPLTISAATMGALDWVDQATLSLLSGGFEDVGEYVILKMYVTYPYLSLMWVAGYVALPEIAARREQISLNHYWRTIAISGGACVAVTATVYLVITALPNLVPVPVRSDVVIWLMVAGAARMLAIGPSSFLGAIGTPRVLRRFATASGAVLALEVGIIILVPAEPIVSAAFGLAIAAVSRLLAQHWMAFRMMTGERMNS
jgi:O-antigen/teichoic acid export membrane protein